MKIQLAIIGAVLGGGGILLFPETVNQLPGTTAFFDALTTDAINFKELNTNTKQIGNTLFDVGVEVADVMVDVAEKVEDTIEDVEISPNQILNLED